MREQPDEAAVLVLDGDVSDVLPVHHAGGEVYEVVGADGEAAVGGPAGSYVVDLAGAPALPLRREPTARS